MKCRIRKSEIRDITESTFTVYGMDGRILKDDATFEEVFSKEEILNLVLLANPFEANSSEK